MVLNLNGNSPFFLSNSFIMTDDLTLLWWITRVHEPRTSCLLLVIAGY